MLPEVKKKLINVVLIVAAVAGLLFVIFAVFLNRGQLIIKAKAPFTVEIQNLKSQACTQDECEVDLAPGAYTAIVKKSGYRDQPVSVNVPMGGSAREEVQLQFIPVLSLLGEDFLGSNGQDAEPNAETVSAITATFNEPVFFEENYVVYLAVNPQTRWQTLYARPLEPAANGEPKTPGEPELLTAFPRTLREYVIVPSIEEHRAVAVIEQTDAESTLYMVDLQQQSRQAILEFPLITDVKWLPGSKDFLVSGWEDAVAQPQVYRYHTATKQTQQLELKAPLKNIAALSADRLLVATLQAVVSPNQPSALEGQLVTLSETLSPNTSTTAQSTGGSTTAGITGAVNFLDYSLVTNQSRLLKHVPDITMPEHIKLEGSGNSVLLLAGSQTYRLQFEE